MFLFFLFLLTFDTYQVNDNDNSIIDGFLTYDFEVKENISNKFDGFSVSLFSSNRFNLLDKLEIPQSGYFIFPTPNDKSCILHFEGPKGTCFDKNNIELILNKENKESFEIIPKDNEDIQVKVTGYTLSGQVTYKTVNISSLFNIELFDKIANKTTVFTTDRTGFFSYKPITPSSYSIQVSNTICESVHFNIINSSYYIKSLNILEKPIRFKLILPSKYQTIFQTEPNKMRLCYFRIKNEESINHEKVDYYEEKINFIFPDNNGEFVLHDLDPGNYSIFSTSFNIHPTYFIVDNETCTFEDIILYYKGITITGEVFYPNKIEYIENATVKLNNCKVKTNQKGFFTIENVMPSDYVDFTVEYPYTEFSLPIIPNITIDNIDHLKIPVENGPISGFVDCDCKSNITIQVGGSIRKTISLNSNGEFGFSSPLGQQVIISVFSSNRICKFEKNVIFAQSPNNNLHFALKTAKVQGNIICVNQCDNLRLKLINSYKTAHFHLVPISQNGCFSFENVHYGEYSFEIVSKQYSKEINFNKYFFFPKITEASEIIVNQEIINLQTFAKQVYQEIKILSPCNMTVFDSFSFINIKKGLNRIFTNSTTIYPLDYHLFDPILMSLSKINEIKIKAIQWLVSIKEAGKDSSSAFYCVFLNDSKLEKPYYFIQNVNEILNVSITCEKPFSINGSSFYILTNETIQSFSSNEIIFSLIYTYEVSGFVSPPVSNVTINCYQQNQKIKTVTTDETGHYEIGSFPYTQHVTILASKDGYIFKRVPKSFNFTSERLVNINIRFENEKEEELKNTIISLTRSDGYRETIVVNNSFVSFRHLSIGEYCITPAKTAYSFYPSFYTLNIENNNTSNEDQTLIFRMKKTKFSISGKIDDPIQHSTENNSFLKDLIIYAQKEGQENAIYMTYTTSNGFFTIQNLPCNSTYKLYVNFSTLTNKNIHSITPFYKFIKLHEQDINDVKFVAIPENNHFDILGNINIERKELISNVFIQLISKSTNKIIDKFVFTNNFIDMFHFIHIKKGPIYQIEAKILPQVQNIDQTIECDTLFINSSNISSSLYNAMINCNIYDKITEKEDDYHYNFKYFNNYKHFFLFKKENLITISIILLWILFFNFKKFL